MAFDALKHALSTAPYLQLPDFDKPFTVDCDASGSGFGAVLHQGAGALAFFSRPFVARHLKLAAYGWELIGLVQAIRHWRPYLWGRHFIVRTDHYALKFMLDQRLCTVPQHQWVSKLFGYDFAIECRLGILNTVADALSRREDVDASISAILGPPSSYSTTFRVWSDITLDFIEGLPRVNSKSVILTVVVQFSKQAHFLALSHPYTAATVAKAFFDGIAQEYAKKNYDARHRLLEFAVDDWVLLRILHQPAQSLVPGWRVGPVAYRLRLPDGARINHVFHVGVLKPFRGTPPATTPALPPLHHGRVLHRPERALRGQLHRGVWNVLIQWESMPKADATREPVEEFKALFPSFQLEDELFVEGGRDVMTGNVYQCRRASHG
ncbi:uncharacterized protein [Miscanthus floridulus]|uniref:uncharacterized protein n=1 Tax=Miscanthus floridulus TaxID=154761 RepID=UPI003458781B